MLKTKNRIIHRRLTLITALPLLLAVLSGSLYSLLQLMGYDYFWLMKVHTGNFFIINFQPFYTLFLGIMTIFATITGINLFKSSK